MKWMACKVCIQHVEEVETVRITFEISGSIYISNAWATSHAIFYTLIGNEDAHRPVDKRHTQPSPFPKSCKFHDAIMRPYHRSIFEAYQISSPYKCKRERVDRRFTRPQPITDPLMFGAYHGSPHMYMMKGKPPHVLGMGSAFEAYPSQ